MELRDYIQKFPVNWQGIFAALCKNHQPLLVADSWLLEHRTRMQTHCSVGRMNRHGNQLDWVEFIDALGEKEPTEVKDQLVFTPRILLFPGNIQRNTFAFLSHHSAEIPIKSLTSLVGSLQNHDIADDWIKHHLRTLQDFVCSKQCPNYGCGHYANEYRSKLTPGSWDMFDRVCQQIREADTKCSGGGVCKLQFDWLPEALSTNPRTCEHRTCFSCSEETRDPDLALNSSKEQNMETEMEKINAERPVKSINTDSDAVEIIEIDSSSNSSLEGKFVDQNSVEMILENSESGASPLGDERFIQPEEVIMVEQEMREDTNARESSIREDRLIDAVTRTELSSLKTALCSLSEDGVTADLLRVLIDCPTDKIEAACDMLDLDLLPAAGLVILTHQLAQFTLELSNASAVLLARRCFLKQIQTLTQTAPRGLITAIICYAKAFPRPTIEGALVPSLTWGGDVGRVTAHQFDLAVKVVKDAFNNESRTYLLSQILSSGTLQWTEDLTGLVQAIVSCKLELDSKMLETFIAALKHRGSFQHSCTKFAKLLLAVVNRFSKQISTSSLAILHQLVDDNQTFLKKALLAAVKRVKILDVL